MKTLFAISAFCLALMACLPSPVAIDNEVQLLRRLSHEALDLRNKQKCPPIGTATASMSCEGLGDCLHQVQDAVHAGQAAVNVVDGDLPDGGAAPADPHANIAGTTVATIAHDTAATLASSEAEYIRVFKSRDDLAIRQCRAAGVK